MTRSPLWREFESGEGLLPRLLRFLVLTAGTLFLIAAAALPLPWPQQALLGGLLVLLILWVHRVSASYLTTLTMILLSCFVTLRYGIWRVHTVEQYLRRGGAGWNKLDAFFVLVVLGAELYAFMALFLGYLQTLWPLRRTPVPLPDDPSTWPEVDLLIPTYNEPLRVVKYTALAAMNIDWPEGKLNVYLLDDGRREEFRHFAEEAGIGYMTRPENENFKAGNINRALERLNAPFVAIFDADHVPTRSFLQLTMGWFERDERLALMQTPQHFYSPDPFERNLNQFRNVPSENELFYGVVQDGNDLWNATSFCGSCAVLRRAALDEIGGLATETVTEDAHTSIRLQKKGWSTAYINIPQAAGLATERLSGHIRQRVRWARGMIQIFRLENPLFARGLKLPQRLCYFNGTAHFLFALPRLVFLTAPLIYLIFGRMNLPGYWAAIVAYAAPHLILLHVTHSRIQGRHRHSFWNEIYETVLAPYILLPTLAAFLLPRKGRFNVTVKGQVVAAGFFDRRIARPFLLLLLANLLGLLCAIPRLHLFAASAATGWKGVLLNLPHRMYHGPHLGIIGINIAWTLFNILLLGVATAVAWEAQQRRRAVRVNVEIPAGVVLPDGSAVQGLTGDLSITGVLLRTGTSLAVKPGDPVRIILPVLDGDAALPATVVGVEDGDLRARFDELTLPEDEALTMVLYSRADSWLGWGESTERDHPLRSLGRILRLAVRGLLQTVIPRRPRPPRGRLATSIVPLLAAAILLPGLAVRRGDAQAVQPAPAQSRTVDAGKTAPAKAAGTPAVKTAGTPVAKTAPAAANESKPAGSKTGEAVGAKAGGVEPARVLPVNIGTPNPHSPSARFEGVSRPPGSHSTARRHSMASAVLLSAAGALSRSDAAEIARGKTAKTLPEPKVAAVKPAAGGLTPRMAIGGATAHGVQSVGPMRSASSPGQPPSADAVTGLRGNPPADSTGGSAASKSEGLSRDSAAARLAAVVRSGWMARARSDSSTFYHRQVLVGWGLSSVLASRYPWVLVLLVVLQAFLIAVLLRAMLRRRARERLLSRI